MKKLLFNGCSFVAGDAIAWEEFKKETKAFNLTWPPKSPTAYKDYIEFRKEYTLAGRVSKLTGRPYVDLSMDGNSNDNIALSTIGFLSDLTPEERSEYHVCIGWTSLTRGLKWSNSERTFLNLNIMHLANLDAYPVQGKYGNWMKEVFVNADEEDHVLNYLANVLLLENFLKGNNIRYTFWKSLDPFGTNIPMHLHLPMQIKSNDIRYDKIIDLARWIQMDNYSNKPWIETSWGSDLDKSITNFISNENHHPNITSIYKFAEKIVQKLI